MNTCDHAELNDNIRRAFDRLRLGNMATTRIGWKPDGETAPILPMTLEDAINIVRNETLGLVAAAVRDEVKR